MPKEIHIYEVIRRPLITEKGTFLQEQNKYLFEVAINANKPQVKQAVEKAFDVKVKTVNLMTVLGKMKRYGRGIAKRPDWKKAVVTLVEGDKIQVFEGI
ncbi:MAG: 50S ribosomal protein L23 [Chloroflexi bacterium]|mgnify:CR=1 FL=1|jgi:large subunit ribosomal protein L23|nr:50S ribosomal protein L23 [Chloroflexota bacterium]MBT7081930.1 50S ribosomal protein L23 [Chloroflexota bacterium]MBT7290500.1 50S ribosomal protein L23 [Chloroflexota bacterium]